MASIHRYTVTHDWRGVRISHKPSKDLPERTYFALQYAVHHLGDVIPIPCTFDAQQWIDKIYEVYDPSDLRISRCVQAIREAMPNE